MSKADAWARFLGSITKSVVTGLANAKKPDEGCGVCPDGQRKRPSGRRPGMRRARGNSRRSS